MNVVDAVIESYGGVQKAQQRFNYTTPQGIYDWRRRGIPYKHILDIHVEKGFDINDLKSRPEAA